MEGRCDYCRRDIGAGHAPGCLYDYQGAPLPVGRYELEVPGWIPASVNELLASVKARIRLKKRDRDILMGYMLAAGSRLKATGKRRLSARFVFGPGERRCDVDNLLKSLCDACVSAGLLVDDGPRWLVLGDFVAERGPDRRTIIVLEEVC